MSLVGKVGRRRPRAVFAMSIVYILLSLGAITTVYPFLLMASTGFKNSTDENDNALVPKYWSDNAELQRKVLDDKYSANVSMIASTRIGGKDPKVIGQYEDYLANLPLDYWTAGYRLGPNQMTCRLNNLYQDWLKKRFATIEELNKTYIEENTAFQQVSPPTENLERAKWVAPNDVRYREWLLFKSNLPIDYRIPIRAAKMYQDFVRGKFKGQWSEVPPEVAGTAKSFDELALPASGELLAEFRATALPARYKTKTAEDLWTAQAGRVDMPIAAYESSYVKAEEDNFRGEFRSRNYRFILDFIAVNGRALWNTAIFCLLAILTQLIVNPLAAYALSRYPIKASGKILLFLLATMAFPAEVAMIPNFLLLKDLHLLNTFAALVLPTAASGYMIFLLKGFFDSLPQELFEASQLDGAKEITIMTRIALPLSKPVLGYLALVAFMAAYGAFIYAFLIAQDQRMWTLTVYIYQLQNAGAPRGLIMAALTLAAIPTLVVFLCAQRVIMRGIVLPGER